jgi:hypothetical protein
MTAYFCSCNTKLSYPKNTIRKILASVNGFDSSLDVSEKKNRTGKQVRRKYPK